MDHNSIKNRELNFKSRLSTSINFKFVCHHILYNWNFACNRIFRIYPFDDRRIKSDLRTIFALIKNMIKNEFTKRIAQGNSIILAISPTNRRFDLARKKKKKPLSSVTLSRQHFALGISILSRRSLSLHLGQALNL